MEQRPIHRLRDRNPSPAEGINASPILIYSRIANVSSRHRELGILPFIGRPTLHELLFLNTFHAVPMERSVNERRARVGDR